MRKKKSSRLKRKNSKRVLGAKPLSRQKPRRKKNFCADFFQKSFRGAEIFLKQNPKKILELPNFFARFFDFFEKIFPKA